MKEKDNTCLQLFCGMEDICVPKYVNFRKGSVSRGMFTEYLLHSSVTYPYGVAGIVINRPHLEIRTAFTGLLGRREHCKRRENRADLGVFVCFIQMIGPGVLCTLKKGCGVLCTLERAMLQSCISNSTVLKITT